MLFILQFITGKLATFWLVVLFELSCIPVASAASDHNPFPNVEFKVFSDFILQQFDHRVTLATVLTVLFSITSNPDLFGLHARQQHPKAPGEIMQSTSGWIKTLANTILQRLGDAAETLSSQEYKQDSKKSATTLAVKLDSLSKILGMHPYNARGIFLEKLKPINEDDISPVHIICPATAECETADCNSRALHKHTRDRDIPIVTLIKGSKIYDQALVLAGQCSQCQTIYYADHEHSSTSDDGKKLYLNSAKYLKIGQKIWVDRVFAGAVVNGVYSFHASTSAYAEFWNTSFWSTQNVKSRKISRRQVWHTFVQESVRQIAQVSNVNLELSDKLDINEVTQKAFDILGESGIIRCADEHACDECSRPYKDTADVIENDAEDPAALVGVDEHQNVPAFTGELDDDDSNEDAMSVDNSSDSSMETSKAPVQMVVMDGIVMGPKHCAFDNCTANLINYQNGVYCAEHFRNYGHLCHVVDCRNAKTSNSLACIQHQALWRSHVTRYGRSNLLGVQRLLRRSEHERLPWVPVVERAYQPHDQPAQESREQVKYHFTAPRFYCVETICAPCGVVIAWTKFAKSESPTNILNFLDSVYPDPSTCPDYVCIDKACQLLRHAVTSHRWSSWKESTRFIVDAYHYINHRTSDYLCRKYCNPAPLNGSAPNLVEVVEDKEGNPHYKRAFNTQACEQLNAWIGGFETLLKRMTTGNFNWLLHAMLFIHTQRIIQRLKEKATKMSTEDDSEEEMD